MGMGKCKGCGHDVHTSAKNCPNCGKFDPLMPWYYRTLIAPAAVLVVLVVLFALFKH